MNFMKKYLILTLVTSFLISEVRTQKCYNIYEDALYLSKFDEYKSLADSILDYAISENSKDFNLYLLKSKLFYEKGQSDEGFQNLIEAVRYGCHIRHNIFTNRFFKNVLSTSDSLKLMHLASSIIEVPFKTANTLALPRLYELVQWDQALNNFTIRFKDSMCITSSKSRILELKITRKMLMQYLEEFGYPDEKEFGEVLVNRFDLVIIHHRQDLDNFFWLENYWEEAYKKGKISHQRYFDFHDSNRVYLDKHQKLGAFESGKEIDGKWHMYPIENVSEIDILRDKSCLCPLFIFAKKNGLTLPETYTYNFEDYISAVRKRIK